MSACVSGVGNFVNVYTPTKTYMFCAQPKKLTFFAVFTHTNVNVRK